MKLTMKTSFFALLIASATGVSAQVNTNEVETTTSKQVVLNEEEAFSVKTETEEIQALQFEYADQGMKEQDLRDTPVMVTKTIWIDDDKDDNYDKKIRMFYTKDEDANLNYITTQDGILIKPNASTSKLVSEEGIYHFNSNNVNSIIVSVDDLEMSK